MEEGEILLQKIGITNNPVDMLTGNWSQVQALLGLDKYSACLDTHKCMPATGALGGSMTCSFCLDTMVYKSCQDGDLLILAQFGEILYFRILMGSFIIPLFSVLCNVRVKKERKEERCEKHKLQKKYYNFFF